MAFACFHDRIDLEDIIRSPLFHRGIMKKTIAILLVAIMAVSSVFALDATLSGKFTSKLAYDLEDNWLGFSEPDNKLSLTLALSTATENEGDIYALVKADMNLVWDASNTTGAGLTEDDLFIGLNADDSKFEISEVGIYGQGWNLSILKAAEMPKYAKGWETYNDGDDNVDLKAPVSFKDDLGVTFTLDNIFKAGFSVDADFDENEGKNFLAWASTDDLNIAGIVVNGAVGITRDVTAASDLTYLGLGLEAGYENDSLSATVASDMSIGIPTEKNVDATFDLDVAANVNYADMVTVDAYYASQTMLGYSYDAKKANPFDGSDDVDTYAVELKYDSVNPFENITGLGRGFMAYPFNDEGLGIENYLSAKVGFDMNAFDVPVKLTLAAMDIVNNPYFDLEAATSVAGFDITVFGGYQAIIPDKDIEENVLHVGAKVAYTLEPVGKLSASTTFLSMIPTAKGAEAQNAMSLELALENTTLVTGATLKAGYKTANIIGGDNALMAQSKGAAYVSATIEF